MEEERRVRYTDDYVPGPEGCPVWGFEFNKIYSTVLFVRAKDEDEASQLIGEYYEKHNEEIEKDIDMSDPVRDGTHWLHGDPETGWNK